MSPSHIWNRKLSLHGAGVAISCDVERLIPQAEQLLRTFISPDLPVNSATASGTIRRFDEPDVLRHVSSRARRLATSDAWLELYQDAERFWMVDERWGIAEMNLLRAQWRSWVLPNCKLDASHLVEGAILWPMAQILRARRLHLLPAASIVREGWGMLLLSPFSLEPELSRLAKHGYKVIGQRWTALREREGTIEMLQVPALMEKGKSVATRRRGGGSEVKWVDLSREFSGCMEKRGLCHAVLIVEQGRRGTPNFCDLSIPEAQEEMKRAWPIADLHPTGRSGLLGNRLAQMCRCARLQLSHDPADLVLMLEAARTAEPQGKPKVMISLPGAPRRQSAA